MKNLNDIFSGVDHVLNSAKHGNFEEVLTKTKNYAEQATKKSAERIEISKQEETQNSENLARFPLHICVIW